MAHLPIPHTLLWCRERSGLTQAEVAFLIGRKSKTNVSDQELGRRTISVSGALGYEALYGLPFGELFQEARAEVTAATAKRAKSLKVKLQSAGTLTKRKAWTLDAIGSNPRKPLMPL